jgi:drug/metabolite transporter (DMT)-like permease
MRVLSRPTRARIEVLLGALAFAASVPAGKILLHGHPPMAISGGLYLAAGLFCAGLLLADPGRHASTHNRLQGSEWWWLGAAVGFGGVLGPLALFYGLRWSSGYMAGLLLNFEVVLTVGLGAALSSERVGMRGLRGIAFVIAGAVALSGVGGSASGETRPWGAMLIIVACACWALDNNFTQRISLRDARQIVAIKGLVGGAANLGLAAMFGQLGSWGPGSLVSVIAVGVVSYGLSIVLFIRGLRELGVMHTGALFALAPGIAAVLSWLVLREPVHPLAFLALAAMTGGALLLATDVHEHVHTHEALEHAHVHEHDEHHQHGHTPDELAQVPHAHRHRHEPLTHAHPHTHDVHHRHPHGDRAARSPAPPADLE